MSIGGCNLNVTVTGTLVFANNKFMCVRKTTYTLDIDIVDFVPQHYHAVIIDDRCPSCFSSPIII